MKHDKENQMINIFIICQNITKSAGTERAVCNLANILSAKKNIYNVNVASVETCLGLPFYKVNDNINFIHLKCNTGNRSKIKRIVAYIKFFKKLYSLKEKNQITFFIGTYSSFNFVISFLGKNCIKIGCEHFGYNAASKTKKIIKRLLYPRLDKVVVLTNSDCTHYDFLRNIVVIQNSLSFPPNRIEDYTIKNILAIGRLTYQKGFDMLIDAAKIINTKFPNWHFTIIGEGEDYDLLQNQIEKLQLQGYVEIKPYQKDVVSLYHSASIYAMSSRYEGLPMVLIEAQSCGLPCVSFDCPEGPSDIIENDVSGYLVEPDNVELFAESLILLMDNLSLREKFGNAAFQNSKNFEPKKIGDKWLSLLEGCLC